MAFTPEDGSGVAGANSYATVEFADAYFLDRGVSAWAAEDDSDKETYLIRATDYVEKRYTRRFIGEMMATDQALSWPRSDAETALGVIYAEDEIPLPLQRAVCEYALRAKDAPLMPDPVVDVTGFNVVTTKKVVGPIEKEFRQAGTSSRPSTVRSYPAADSLITQLLLPGTGGTRVIR